MGIEVLLTCYDWFEASADKINGEYWAFAGEFADAIGGESLARLNEELEQMQDPDPRKDATGTPAQQNAMKDATGQRSSLDRLEKRRQEAGGGPLHYGDVSGFLDK